ncbi:MAG: glycosyltransferase family 9 protein, partial [Planctomycetota bacterium]
MAERILVVRNRFIGDTVLAIPFLRNLRRRFPAATIDVLVEQGAGAALADCPYKDALLTWRRPRRICGIVPGSFLNILGYAVWLRSRRYDRAYILKRSLSSVLLAWLAGIGHRVGFASRVRTPLLTCQVPLQKSRHEAELFLDLLRGDGIEVDDGHNENWVWPAAATKVDAMLAAIPGGRPRVFIAPQATDFRRLWPLDRLAAVIEWLVHQRGCEIFVCGGPKDDVVHAAIVAALGTETAARVHDFSQELSLRETAALLSRMDL